MAHWDKWANKYRAAKTIKGVRKNKMFKTKGEAKRWEAQQTEEAWIAEQQALASMSLLEWSVKYLEYSIERHSAKTYKEEKLPAFKRLLETMAPQTSVDEVTIADTFRVLEKRAKESTGNAANKDRKNLSAAWSWGTKYLDMPKDNPFAAVDKFPATQHPRYVPPEADFWLAYDMAEGDDKILLLAFLHTGARKKEMFNLKWDDVDLINSKVRLWTRKRYGGSLEYDWVPLTKRLTGALTEHAKSKRGEFVFCHEDGIPFTDKGHLIPRLCEKAGVKRFNYHGIRHLTASMLAQEGIDIPTIQAILRHKNSMTTTRYIHRLGITDNALEKVFGK